MMDLKVFLILCVVPCVLSQCVMKKAEPQLRRAIYDFSIELLTRIAQEKENHFVASTLSPWTLLSCLSLGAADNTLAELKHVLKLHYHKCFNNLYLEIVSKINSNSDPHVTVERSAVMFADEELSINDAFKNRIASTGISDIEVISLGYADAAAAMINNYVSRATHNAVEDMVNPSDLEDVYLVMIDALFFKGTWETPFVAEETETSPFYNERGVQIGDVNLMFVNGMFHEKSIDQIDANVLELPYGNSGRYSALFFVPYPDVPVYNVIEKLKLITLTTIFKQFDEKESVMVQIPRFKIVSDLNNMRELLRDMGLESMFVSEQARFPYLSDDNLSVSEFFQKASIEVTEEGTTASAATAAELVSRSFPIKYTANKPFLFMIVDKVYEVPLFAGAYSKPSEY
ncbi:serine protease inhibitor 77Ba-like [Zerene cesonia]|uniref:serine protease inhibitor 77Ba-like n=1 Tax=Zerene cesonia TaxID=33412 RepID=UPI0018E529CA|nr:serine protease inhibitor 77Ba-like [Zerene cesonia]